jgi:hypothetical protein
MSDMAEITGQPPWYASLDHEIEICGDTTDDPICDCRDSVAMGIPNAHSARLRDVHAHGTPVL